MERRAIVVRGIVQGVGFRPFVYATAQKLNLAGSVRNHNGSVYIEIEGGAHDLDRFAAELQDHPPPLAVIEQISATAQPARGQVGFVIEASDTDGVADARISPDVSVCPECVAEIFDPANRRFRYPFINCTHCGPRLTIILGAPYDRHRTTMASFAMCDACRGEYENPTDRRFHAQPIACAACGPRLSLVDAAGRAVEGDPVMRVIVALRAGKIVAIKGLGGFHLACDAGNATAVAELRRRKKRDEKPFAVMARDAEIARRFCRIDPEEQALLESRARPIVLLTKTDEYDLAAGVAPRNPLVGLMLPYTPLHYLLFDALAESVLVMTSGNASDEPIAYENSDAQRRLADIADLFLLNDRPIHVRCDDSVTRRIAGAEAPIRRSRGYAPQPIALPIESPLPLLAVGGQLKNTFALARGNQAILSHHLGDLDHFENFRAFERDVKLYEELFALQPRAIVHDLHPDYASTRYALQRAAAEGIPTIAVQHHHAHLASAMAEHGLKQPVIGVILDGTGYGADGHIWGGEFLVGDYADFHRDYHLRDVPLPGGDRAIYEPWRCALAHLRDAGETLPAFERQLDAMQLRVVDAMLQRRFNSPLTSSAGRLFDAVAALIGLRQAVRYEAQAAMDLEWAASNARAEGDAYPFEIRDDGEIDTRPLIRAVVADLNRKVEGGVIARRFHRGLAQMISDVCARIRDTRQIDTIVLSGGVWLNALLSGETMNLLTQRGFVVYRQTRVPAGDGGLSLGQLSVGIFRVAKITSADLR